MIVYNTTFHIDKDIVDKTLDYIRKTYIPDSVASGFLQNPCLRRVMHTEENGENYAVQFHVKNIDTLHYWLKNEGVAINNALNERFGNKIAGFVTCLEEMELDK